jgi:hypothetical protein
MTHRVLVTACAAVLACMAGRAVAASPTFGNPLNITNPLHPFPPGAVKVFAGSKDKAKTVIVDIYKSDTRTFQLAGADVPCHVLQETEFEGGQLSEISQNFFAQADDGAVYYFGEVVDEYENGVVASHEGSWLVGGPTTPGDPPETANASTPGLFMPASPAVGDTFKPEDLLPVVDETDTVKAVGKAVGVPAGRFANAIQVLETSQLPGAPETKWYAPGIGVLKGKTQGERFALIASTFGTP